MAGAEGIVHIAVGEPRQAPGELGIAFLLALVEPDVLQDDDPAGCQRGAGGLGFGADRVADLRHRSPDQRLQAGGDGVQPERGVAGRIPGGPAEVAHQDQAAAALEDGIQGRQRTANPAVVGDLAVGGLGHVEIDADEDFLAGHVDVANRLLRHRSFPGHWTRVVKRTVAGRDRSSRRGPSGPWSTTADVVQKLPSLVSSSAVRLE